MEFGLLGIREIGEGGFAGAASWASAAELPPTGERADRLAAGVAVVVCVFVGGVYAVDSDEGIRRCRGVEIADQNILRIVDHHRGA